MNEETSITKNIQKQRQHFNTSNQQEKTARSISCLDRIIKQVL